MIIAIEPVETILGSFLNFSRKGSSYNISHRDVNGSGPEVRIEFFEFPPL